MPPDENETGPALESEAGPTDHATNETISNDISRQLARRRDAAARMPPLASGKRDPWTLSPSDGGDAA